tara:strand:+ start:871 stop:1110 length:240 start_codon:yes stop_codon:yes gene_type:complete
MHSKDTLKEKILHLVEYAKHSKQEELDNVVKVFVNFIREQRIDSLKEILEILKNKEQYEAIVKKGQREETPEFPEGQTL